MPTTDDAAPPERHVPFDGLRNLRDLGGYPTASGTHTRWGLVYRADSLHKLTAADLPGYHRLGIRTVYDLRSEAERTTDPGPVPTVHVPIVGRADGEISAPRTPNMSSADGESLLRDIYVGALVHSAPQIGVILRGLAEPTNGPALFHCHGGKDRTGIVAAVLLLALGVPRETVLDDYELTSRYLLIEANRDSFDSLVASGLPPEAAASVMGTPRWAMADAIEAIDNTHGGIENYITGTVGLTASQLNALRESLTAAI